MNKENKMKLEDLIEPFYQIMNISEFLTMDEIQIMYEALLEHRGIPIPDYWERFIENINCVASEKRKYFYDCFINDLIRPNF